MCSGEEGCFCLILNRWLLLPRQLQGIIGSRGANCECPLMIAPNDDGYVYERDIAGEAERGSEGACACRARERSRTSPTLASWQLTGLPQTGDDHRNGLVYTRP